MFLIVCYWFYFNICFDYFLSKIFYDFFDSINKTSLSNRKQNIELKICRSLIEIKLKLLVKFIYI